MTTLKYFITSKAKRNLLKFFLTDIDASYYTREAARLTGEPLNAVRRELGYLEKAGLLRSRMQGNLKYYEVVKGYPLLAEWRKIILETADDITFQPGPVTAPSDSTVTEIRAAKQSTGSHSTAKIEAAKHSPLEDGDKPIIPGSRVIPNHEVSVIAPPAFVIADEAKQSIQSEQPHPTRTLDYLIDHLREKLMDINSISIAIIHGEAARAEKIPQDGIELLVVGDINKDILLELIAECESATGIDISLMHLTNSDFDYRNAQGDPFIRRIWGEKKLVIKGRH
jgi:DNA-binding transcriptional ArsR family regulator